AVATVCFQQCHSDVSVEPIPPLIAHGHATHVAPDVDLYVFRAHSFLSCSAFPNLIVIIYASPGPVPNSCIPGVSRACGLLETVDAGEDGCGSDDSGADHGAVRVNVRHDSYDTRAMMRMQATRGTDNGSHSRMSD